MERWTVRICFTAGLLCPPLWAQDRDPTCGVVPSFRAEHPQPLEDQNQCDPETSRPAVAGVVSARALAHKPSRAAAKEFDRGVQAWRRGQTELAVSHLKEAVRLDSDFTAALAELGAVYGAAGQPALALDCFTRAAVLEPNSALFHSDKAAALVALNRPEEAEPSARRAVQLDPSSIAAHYLLGVAMAMQEKITPETAAHLAATVGRYPRASAYLADVQAALAATPH